MAKVRKGQVTVLQPYSNDTAKVGRKTRPGSETLEVCLAKEKNLIYMRIHGIFHIFLSLQTITI